MTKGQDYASRVSRAFWRPSKIKPMEAVMRAGEVQILNPDKNPEPIVENDVMQQQVGGDHYKKHKIQPWHIVDAFKLCFYLGNAVKYILRDKNDNQLEDLKKARHYLDKKISMLEDGK